MRRTGQTLAMVKALPATGSIVVVHTEPLRRYVEKMIHDVRGAHVLKVTRVIVPVSAHQMHAAVEGRKLPVFVDHAFAFGVPRYLADYVHALAQWCNERGTLGDAAHG